jgi:site-specific DNA-methyltransferase (adenine-specific)
LKPGGHLLAFSGSRTYHRMAFAIEAAGFEIRDQIMWIYGSGFPKSRNVSADMVGDDAAQWQGWGTALKPSHEPICMARKPLSGTVAANLTLHGTGAINVDSCRITTGGDENPSIARRKGSIAHLSSRKAAEAEADGRLESRQSPEAYRRERMGEALGRWPANVIHDGSDEVLDAFAKFGQDKGQSAHLATRNSDKTRNTFGAFSGSVDAKFAPHDELGSAARFFYCAKASRTDRNEGIGGSDTPAVETEATMRDRETADWQERNGNFHPTVKPADLMAYLCRLVTPPNGVVLDPFMGSGSTGKAAIREGFRFIGIDVTPEYVEIARARIQFEADRVEQERIEAARQPDMFAEVA